MKQKAISSNRSIYLRFVVLIPIVTLVLMLAGNLASPMRAAYADDTGARKDVGTPIVVSHDTGGLEVTITPTDGVNRPAAEDADGNGAPDYYTYYTGEEAPINVEISNRDNTLEGYKARVYIRYDSANPRLPYSLGENSITSAGRTYSFSFNQSSESGVYYLEFPKPEIGATATVPLHTMYPSPGTPGGKVDVWAAVLSPDELTSLGNGVTAKGDWAQLDWNTVPDPFPVTKTASSTEVYLMGDGQGGNTTIHGLVYDFDLVREGDTLEGMGKDYVKEARFTDTIQLDADMKWKQEVLDGIRNGNFRVKYYSSDTDFGINTSVISSQPIVAMIYVNDTKVASIWHGNTDTLWDRKENIQLSVDGNNQVQISWSSKNSSIDNNPSDPARWSEIQNVHYQMYIGNEAIEYTGNIDDPLLVTEGKEITNHVSVTETYCYSEDKTYESQVIDTVKARSAELTMRKFMYNMITRGEELARPVDIYVKSVGSVPYTSLYKVSDYLPYEFYVAPEGIFEFLSSTDHPDADKVLKIYQASIYELPSITRVRDYHDNADHKLNVENTADVNTYDLYPFDLSETALKKVRTLRLYKDGSSYKCVVLNGTTEEESFTFSDAASLQEGFDNLGYFPTHDARYEVMWLYDPEPSLTSGEERVYNFRIWAKDSFQVAQGDQLEKINLEGGSRWNYAYTYKRDGTRIDSDGSPCTIAQDMRIAKGAKLVGEEEELEEGSNLNLESVIDYSVKVTHDGNHEYDVMPLVDCMQGIQCILARKDLNPSLASQNLPTYSVLGEDYYILNRPGTYQKVWLGEPDQKALADHIVIKQTTKGLTSISYYYLDDFKGENPDGTAIERKIVYRTLVHKGYSGAQEASRYRLDNCGLLNDHQGHRIYDPVGFGVSPIYFDKRVIDERGTTPTSDVNVRDFSFFEKGEKTTYRFVFGANSPVPGVKVSVSGSEIWDMLPEAVTGLAWHKGDGTHPGDVTIAVHEDPGNVIWTNPDHWNIVSDTHDQNNTNQNQYYIEWADDFKVEFEDRAYIYVTLTMPEDDVWNAWAQEFLNTRLRNSLHLNEYQSFVEHELSEPIKAYLEKGVYATGLRISSGRPQNQRFQYLNESNVYYTVALVNTGDARLYVNELQDKLPEGFSFHAILEYAGQSTGDSITYSNNVGPCRPSYNSNFNPNTAAALLYKEGVAQKSGVGLPKYARVKAETVVRNGHEYITFKVSPPTEDTTLNNEIKYDDRFQKCYLDPGEMLSFCYQVIVSDHANTTDTADNTIVMPVSDYAGAGVKVEEADVRTHEFGTALPNEGTCDHDAEFNPTRNDRIENLGFVGEDTDTAWLKSDVRLTRGLVVPGITKSVTSVIDADGREHNNPTVARKEDTVRFLAHATNTGNQNMVDYVLQDTIPAPYKFTGPITLTFTSQGGTDGYVNKTVSACNFNIISRTHHLGKDRLEFEYTTPQRLYSPVKTTITVDGDPVKLNIAIKDIRYSTNYIDTNVWVSVETETDGSETIKFAFEDKDLPLSPNDSVDMDIRVYNPSQVQILDELKNNCFIAPITQSFDSADVTQGNNTTITFRDGQSHPAVRNSVALPFAQAYQTSSYKKVEQLSDPDNWGLSYMPDRNWINLPTKNTLFAFTDFVHFETDEAIKDLIIIDNLPEVGDHMTNEIDTKRDSKFEVSLYENPQFEVKVTTDAGDETILDPSTYTIDYTDKTEFTSADWKLEAQSPDPWYSSPKATTRSFRVRIFDPGATQIPAESTVSIRYVCEITDEALDEIAGLISWNSFAYRYLVNGQSTYLEAAPLKVGIRFPLPPSVQKKLVDRNGDPFPAKEDASYTFLTFKGSWEDLDLDEGFTDEELGAALMEKGLEFGLVDATIAAGETESEPVRMNNEAGFVKWTFKDGTFKKLEGADAWWTWVVDETYTTLELPSSQSAFSASKFYEDLPYETYNYTWRYDVDLTCTNMVDTWDLMLTKYFFGPDQAPEVSSSNYAVFGLYSPNIEDALSEEALAAKVQEVGLSTTPSIEYETEDAYRNTVTFYLMDLKRLSFEGVADYEITTHWKSLTESQYVLKELEAPSDFIVAGDILLLKDRPNTQDPKFNELREMQIGYSQSLTAWVYNYKTWTIRAYKADSDEPYKAITPAGFVLYGPENHTHLTQDEFDQAWTSFQAVEGLAQDKPPYSISYTLPDGTETTLFAVDINSTFASTFWGREYIQECTFYNLSADYYVLREIFTPGNYALADDMLVGKDDSVAGADYYVNASRAEARFYVNNKPLWSIELTKRDEAAADGMLAGAVFGIYGSDSDDALSAEDITRIAAELGLDEAPSATFERSGETYYLAGLAKSTADAPMVFEDLVSDFVVARELKAPEGYFPAGDIVFSKNADEDDSTIDAVLTETDQTITTGGREGSYTLRERLAKAEVENHITKTCTATIEASKTMTGRKLNAGEFSFELVDAEGNVVETVFADAQGKVVFSELEFDEYDMATEHSYTIREAAPETPAGGVTYDGHEETVRVELSYDEQGELVAKVVYDEDGAAFKNSYSASGEVVLEVTKKLVGAELSDKMFSFELTDEAGNVIETVANDAEGKVAFTKLSFTEADAGNTYTYKIREVTEDKTGQEWANYTFDEHGVTARVTITDNGDGTVSASVVYEGNTVFTNSYEEPEKPKKPTPKKETKAKRTKPVVVPHTGDAPNFAMAICSAAGSLATLAGVLAKKRENE